MLCFDKQAKHSRCFQCYTSIKLKDPQNYAEVPENTWMIHTSNNVVFALAEWNETSLLKIGVSSLPKNFVTKRATNEKLGTKY